MYRVVYEKHSFGPFHGSYALYFGNTRLYGGVDCAESIEARIKRGLAALSA
jgi:hypothetical protein